MFFESVLPRVNRDDFLREFFGKKILFQKQAHSLNEKVTVKDIDSYLSMWEGYLDRIVFPSTGLTRHVIQSSEFNPVTQKQQVETLYRGGATLKVEGLALRHPIFSVICRNLEELAGGRSYASIMLTPRGQAGYKVHFDTSEVFAVQLEGSKQWKTFESDTYLPTQRMSRDFPDEDALVQTGEYLLEAGDVLYLPAGVPHCATCTHQHSFHVSIGLDPWRSTEIAQYMLGVIAENEESFRDYLLANDPTASVKLGAVLAQMSEKLAAINPDEALTQYKTAFVANRPHIGSRGIFNASVAQEIGSDSVFEFDRNALHSYAIQDDKITLSLGSAVPAAKPLLVKPPLIELPSYVDEDLAAIFTSEHPFKAQDLVGKLDEESKVLLLSQLAEYGVVNVNRAS